MGWLGALLCLYTFTIGIHQAFASIAITVHHHMRTGAITFFSPAGILLVPSNQLA